MKAGNLFRTLALFATVPFLACGGGGPTSGGEESVGQDQFASNDDSAGRLELVLDKSELGIGETAEFRAFVYDAENRPVPSMRVQCNSERGVALVEPTSGVEFTGARGAMSGIIGCAAPGSYQFVCFLPTGTGRRTFASVRCSGVVPEGFAGFTGAGGGTLGGGVVPPAEGGPGSDTENQVRITNVSAFTIGGGTSATTSIDTVASRCGVAPDTTAEPFGDDYLEVEVFNNGDELVRFRSVLYSVPNGADDGTSYRSPNIAITGESEAKPNTAVKYRFLFLDAVSGFPNKAFANGGTRPGAGFQTINVRINGVTASGREVNASGQVTLSFDGFNYCAS